MRREEIGKLVSYERNKKNMTVKTLSLGICSETTILRLERGKRIPDFFLVERIMERLGKSMNKVEFLYDEQTYEIYYLRELIEKYILQKEYGEAERALHYYEGLQEAGEPLHIQYICKMQAVLAKKQRKDAEVEESLIKRAIEQTMKGFLLANLKKYNLGEEEIILLLMYMRIESKMGKMNILQYSEEILHYIEYNFSDDEVFVNLYSKAAWIFVKELKEKGKRKEALIICIKSVELLTGNGLLLHLPQYLEMILEFEKDLNESEYTKWKKQRDALKQVYEEYGYEYEIGEIELWQNYHLNEVCLVSELISGERKVQNETQEEMADEMKMDSKTISRIEHGRYKAKQGTFQKMKKYLEFDRDTCNTSIVVENFALLELEREIAKEGHYRRFGRAEKLYQELKSKMSMEFNENIQYVKYMDCYFARIFGGVKEKEAVEKCLEAFRVTRKDLDLEDLDKVVLTKNEAMIMHYIAILYKKLNQRKEAIKILEKIKAGYENSRVDTKYHYREIALIYQSLGVLYEEADQFDKAVEMYEKGIRLDLKCKRALILGNCIQEKAYTKGRQNRDEKSCQYYYQQAFWIFELTKKYDKMKALKQYWIENYGEEIN